MTTRLPLRLSTYPFHCWSVIPASTRTVRSPCSSGRREACCAGCCPSGHPIVEDHEANSGDCYSPFCQECCRSWGYSLGCCPSRHPPVSLLGVDNPGYSRVGNVEGLGLFKGLFRFKRKQKVVIPVPACYSRSCPTPPILPPDSRLSDRNSMKGRGHKREVLVKNDPFRRPCVGVINCSQDRQKGARKREYQEITQECQECDGGEKP